MRRRRALWRACRVSRSSAPTAATHHGGARRCRRLSHTLCVAASLMGGVHAANSSRRGVWRGVCAAVIVLSLRCANECRLRCVARLKQALCAICAEHINNARQVWRWGRNAFAVLTVRAQVDINLRWRVAHGRRRHVTGAAAARDDVHASRVSERCVGSGAARDHCAQRWLMMRAFASPHRRRLRAVVSIIVEQ
jgi:hypothetical protein